MSKSPTRRPWLLLIISLLFNGCMALPFLIPPLVQFGANLLSTAASNYGNYHKQNMENLLVSLQQPTNPNMTQGINANPYDGQTGGYQQTGYPNQDYPSTQGYPFSPDYSQQGYDPYQSQTPQYGTAQGYPTSPDYSQQGYDPYQNQAPQYGGNPPYPDNRYPNQGQQGNPYSNNPVYPNQQASVPGYPSYPQNQFPPQGQQSYPNPQNPYPNPTPYPNQPPYPGQGQPYPDTSYPLNQQGQTFPTPYGHAGTPSAPSYPNQPPYPGQGQPYPDTSYPLVQQGPTYPTPYGHAGTPSAPPYPNQPTGTSEYQTAQSATVQPAAVPISLDVLLVKNHVINGVQSYLPIKDGDILLDGRGNPQAGDKFRVMFRANTDCYVYVIAVDGSAWAQGIFPSASSPFANPVKAGQQHVLPEGKNWFSLDQFKGIETVFFVASRERRQDIEQILTTITGRERHPAEKPQSVSEPAIIPNGYSGARPGSSPFAFQTSQNQQQELVPTTYFVKTAGEDLRITRWFRHQ